MGSRATAATFPFRSQTSRAPAKDDDCSSPGPITCARHTSARAWRSGQSVSRARASASRASSSAAVAILLGECASPCHPPEHLHDNVAFRSVPLGEPRSLDGFRAPPGDAERIGEEPRDRRGGADRTHLADGVVGPAQDRDCLAPADRPTARSRRAISDATVATRKCRPSSSWTERACEYMLRASSKSPCIARRPARTVLTDASRSRSSACSARYCSHRASASGTGVRP